LPEKQRNAWLIPLLHNYIPHISAPVIVKYATDLELLGLL
jgi:hypothetical protein